VEIGGELEGILEQSIKQWNLYKDTFIIKCGSNGLVLKLLPIAHDEEPYVQIVKQHGNRISLVGMYGRSERFARERLLGYILLYSGNPQALHVHTWFAYIGYSDKDDIRRKDPKPIAADDNIRLFTAGIGQVDYFWCYKAKTREHDEAGFSDGAAHLETSGQWKDGL
jgi:hypothetical protein